MTGEHTPTTALPCGKQGTAARRRFVAAFSRQYDPCDTGVHVNGFNDDLPYGPDFTILNLPMGKDAARAAFAEAREAYEVAREDGDVLVELHVDESVEQDFWMRRQMVEPMQRGFTNARCVTDNP